MIHALLLRLKQPGLYQASVALNELRKLVRCLARTAVERRRLHKTRARLNGILRKAVKEYSCQENRVFRGIEQLLLLVEKGFLEIKDRKLHGNGETEWFLSAYISLLDAMGSAAASRPSKSAEAALRAERLLAAGRKQLALFRAGRLSEAENFIGNLESATLYSDFDKWLSECGMVLENIMSARRKKQ